MSEAGDFKDGDWFACENPERMPVLDVTWFHHLCRPCWLAAKAMDPHWKRGKWPLLSEILADTPQNHRGRAKLDSELSNVHRYEPPLVIGSVSVVQTRFYDEAV